MKWIIALGMFSQFISFWLAAPELIGDAGLKRLNTFLKNLISNLSIILLTLIISGFAVSFSVLGILRGLDASETGITTREIINYMITLAIAFIVYLFFLFKFKKIKFWLDNRVAAPLIHKFTYNNRFRRNSLIAGAILFTFGFMMQFIVILIQP